MTPRLITPEEAAAEGLPKSVDPVMVFDDNASGRRAAWVRMDVGTSSPNVQDWLLWKHPDGQWVTWRKLNDRDHQVLAPLVELAKKAKQPAAPVGEGIGPAGYTQVVESLKHLTKNDVQLILHAAAVEMINRMGGLAGKSTHPSGQCIVCWAYGPAVPKLTEAFDGIDKSKPPTPGEGAPDA